MTRDHFLRRLVDLQYTRNDIEFTRGQFRVRGDTVELCPAGPRGRLARRVLRRRDRAHHAVRAADRPQDSRRCEAVTIYPGKQFVTPAEKLRPALLAIREELGERIAWFEKHGKLLEAQRIKMRTEYDLEMMEEMGFCSGIENYSRHLAGRAARLAPLHAVRFLPQGLPAGD